MDARRLKALLRTLRSENVATYRCTPDGDVSVSFHDGTAQVAAPQPADEDGDTLALPSGLVDPRKRLREVYARNAAKRGEGAS